MTILDHTRKLPLVIEKERINFDWWNIIMSFEVSVIVPNYNNAKYLEKCIRSIYDQSFKNFEIILIDDNSSDNPEKEIKKYKNFENFKFIKLKKNKGPAFVRNLGMRKSKNEYVAFLDSDDFGFQINLKNKLILCD